MRTFLRENALSLFFAAIFLSTIVAQSFAGQRAYNAEQREHDDSQLSWTAYVTSPDYWGAVMENWQSDCDVTHRTQKVGVQHVETFGQTFAHLR